MHSSPLAALCPAVAETWMAFPDAYAHSAQPHPPQPCLRPKGRPAQPAPGLALSFTLPGDIRSARIARTATAAALEAHGLAPYVWPVTHAVTELVSVTARMSPGRELYVSLRLGRTRVPVTQRGGIPGVLPLGHGPVPVLVRPAGRS
ncbi:hypothetical protein ABT025_03105 [Streptomyces sp. NPDC002809]|uniref:hypothetical protein n=1 Tax=Streptomyces sp. NPDC002809 TaxID=3154433 RepID=UPI0033225261